MPAYTWKGKSRTGKAQEGVIVADSKEAVAFQLRRQAIVATAITEKGKEFNLPTFGGGVTAKELAVFTRQFSVMIDAGLPLVQSLEILASQQENKVFQKVLIGTRGAVEGGSTLSAAIVRMSPDRLCVAASKRCTLTAETALPPSVATTAWPVSSSAPASAARLRAAGETSARTSTMAATPPPALAKAAAAR